MGVVNGSSWLCLDEHFIVTFFVESKL